MTTLTTADAVMLVRKNLDETDPNGSVMYTDQAGDNASIDDIIVKMLPEAINTIHMAAPVQLLEGVEFEASQLEEDSAAISDDGVLSFALASGSKWLRLVAFRAADSAIVVSDVIAEASPEGRKQLNPHIRGRKDRPRLVQLQGRHTGPAFRYYTLDTLGADYNGYVANPASAIGVLVYIQEQIYDAAASSYDISRRLRQNIVDCLTAKVMEAYGDQRATQFYEKSTIYPIL